MGAWLSRFVLSMNKNNLEMKKTIKLLAVVIILMTSVYVNASEKHSISVFAIDGKKLEVKLTNLQGKAVSYVKDIQGTVLLQKKIKSADSELFVFDVSNLSEGKYFFVIEDDSKNQSVPFEISKDDVKVDMEAIKRTYFPKIETRDNMVFVKLLADETNDLSIEIKSGDGDILFDEILKGKQGLIGRHFKFNRGNYVLTLSSNDYYEIKPLAF